MASSTDPDRHPRRAAAGRKALGAVRWGAVVTLTAVTGGIAAVLWNRGLLRRLREAAAAPPPQQAPAEDDV